MSITVNTTTLKTHNTLIADAVLVEGVDTYTAGAIGDKKILLLECTFSNPVTGGTNDITDKEVIFNPALYLPAPYYLADPGTGYYIKPYSTLVNDTPYEMALIGNGTFQTVNQNWKCYYIPKATAGQFHIQFEFYLTADIGNFISGASIQNRDRLLKNHIANNEILENEDLSVYNMPKQIICYLSVKFMVDDDAEELTPDVEYIDTKLHPVSVDFRFYDSGLDGAESEFTDFNYGILDALGADATALSTYENYKVWLRITGSPTAVAAWLIRTDTTANNKTFYQNYEASFSQITTVGGTGVINNAIIKPTTALAVVGTEKETTFFVDRTKLDFDGEYRVIAVYYDNVNDIVNSFITEPIYADAYPPGCSPSMSGVLKCYNRTYGNYITAAPHDRIKSELTIDGLDLSTCIADYVPVDLGIWRYFNRLDISIYYLDGTKRHILEEAYIDQVGVTGSGPYQYNLQTISPNLDIEATFTTLADGEGLIKTTFRIRNDSETNVRTLEDGIYSAPEVTQDWRGKTIYIEYKLSLYYSNAPAPYTDITYYTQKIDVRAYENDTMNVIESIKLKNPATSAYVNSVDGLGSVIVEVKLDNAVVDDFNLIALLDRQTYNVRNIIEEEAFTSTRLDQLTNDVMSAVDSTYDAITKIAEFTIDLTQLNDELKYKIMAIAKKV